ncbi:hypothetical protein K431DRAFT_134142 [Polychaeton citri CBS 116435]|uniref:Uncharacterized protein n=1 Tax=Polychaeton citri CBS 116435 TaxID=1314669 RepID=A0A9P4QEP0_9PEZI|nr:hypothetical protein K431DRAFT_134142 [Polychaeton citri CBS 116435]
MGLCKKAWLQLAQALAVQCGKQQTRSRLTDRLTAVCCTASYIKPNPPDTDTSSVHCHIQESTTSRAIRFPIRQHTRRLPRWGEFAVQSCLARPSLPPPNSPQQDQKTLPRTRHLPAFRLPWWTAGMDCKQHLCLYTSSITTEHGRMLERGRG